MILFRYKWRWDANDMRIVKNFYWKILRECKWDFDGDDDRWKFPTLFAKDAKDALTLAGYERAIISNIREVDNFKELKKQVIEKYRKELADVRNNQLNQNSDDKGRSMGLDRNRAGHKGRLESARDQLLLLFGMRGADTGATH
jgi:hypothetical protein